MGKNLTAVKQLLGFEWNIKFMNDVKFRPPRPGEIVPMRCLACNHKAGGKIPKTSLFGKNKPIKCPLCGKRTFVPDYSIQF